MELLRARWRRALAGHALETVDRQDFALSSLAKRLRTPSVQLFLLPPDPEVQSLDLDEAMWAWMHSFRSVEVEGRTLTFGIQDIPFAHAAAMVESYGSGQPWNSYLAVHRSGAIEYGLGDRGAWEREGSDGNSVRTFYLTSIVARTWALLKFGSALRDRFTGLPLPYLFTLALRGTEGALLGGLGQGWAEPSSYENRVTGCPDRHLLWHFQFDEWPDDRAAQRLAFVMGDRIEDAWGVKQRRYLAHRGDRMHQLDVRTLSE